MYNFKLMDILIFFIILIIIILLISFNNNEHLTAQSNESVQNVSSIYGTGLMTVTNLNVTGEFNMIPKGAIIMWNGTTIPTGWLLCDGTNGTPNLQGRFVLGAGSSSGLTNRTFANQGGEENHTLGINEIPEHYHQVYIGYFASDGWNGGVFDSNGRSTTTGTLYGFGVPGTGAKTDSNNGIATVLAGTSGRIGVPGNAPVAVGSSHNNMPPYYVLTYIMKA